MPIVAHHPAPAHVDLSGEPTLDLHTGVYATAYGHGRDYGHQLGTAHRVAGAVDVARHAALTASDPGLAAAFADGLAATLASLAACKVAR